ncbi:hypothetical protein EV359DRAFT_81014 [Lentinula novae-zelandiae]|nr:hypothetical protein EV359DRAFT_81014 [Lentinula novae-zelandiae]
MTTLPSFVELMASLGINAKAGQPERACTPSSSDSSPSSSPKLLGEPTPSLQSKSSPSLRDQGRRSQSTRFSPYSSTFISARRRSSISPDSSSSSSDTDGLSERQSSSCSPTLRSSSLRTRKRAQNRVIVNVFGSSPDLSANTPISSYVRRKTPGTSPSSPSFPRDFGQAREFSKPFIMPTLPSFLPASACKEAFSLTPNLEMDNPSVPPQSHHGFMEFSDVELNTMSRRSHFHTGIRISTPLTVTDHSEKEIHHRIVHVA